MIPLRDDVPSSTRPIVNYLLIVSCTAVFLYMLSLGSAPEIARFVSTYGAIPSQVLGGTTGAPPYLTLVTSLFLHGGWVHLLGNMLYLWVFGDNVEDLMGHGGYLLFYLIAGVIATLTHVFLNPTSTLPVVGASGAIAGVLGAYLVLFPRARILSLVPLGYFLWTARVPALFFLPVWFLMQFLTGLASIHRDVPVAWAAHVGGFIAGLLLVLVFAHRGRPEPGW
jgi:membrane associated rhomboid family serine protease